MRNVADSATSNMTVSKRAIILGMPKYVISTTIKSTLVSVRGKSCANFRIYTPRTDKPDELIIESVIEAADWKDALNSFRPACFRLLDALSMASGAPATWFTSSYLIEKQGDSTVLFFLKAVSRKARLRMSDEIVSDAETLYQEIQKVSDVPLANLRLAISTSAATPKLMLSLFAAENIAGDVEVPPRCSCGEELACKKKHKNSYPKTNKDELISIMGEELYSLYFNQRKELKNRSIRTSLAHGYEIVLTDDDVRGIDNLLLRLTNHIRNKFGVDRLLSKTSSFEDIVTTFEPWERTMDRADIYLMIEKRISSDMESIGYNECGIPAAY